jgi:hypothetical protein
VSAIIPLAKVFNHRAILKTKNKATAYLRKNIYFEFILPISTKTGNRHN